MAVALTSVDELKELFSDEGVSNHTEDLFDNQAYLERIIAQATEQVMVYLRSQFDIEDLAKDIGVRQKATYIAAYTLSIRRGNPSIYGALLEQALVDLSLIRDGHLTIAAPSKSRAVVQTPSLDNRYYHPQRFDPEYSTRLKPNQRSARHRRGGGGF